MNNTRTKKRSILTLAPHKHLGVTKHLGESWEIVITCTSRKCLEHTMNTMRMVTQIYTMNKVVGNNEKATSKRDSEWMGGRGKGMGVNVLGFGVALC